MKIKQQYFAIMFLLLFSFGTASVYLSDNPLYYIETGSASIFELPKLREFHITNITFQIGPSLQISRQLDRRKSLIFAAEHLYWQQRSYRTGQDHAQRVGLISLYLKRSVTAKSTWGVGYVLCPNRKYYSHPFVYGTDKETGVGLLGLGAFLTFREQKLTITLHGNFVNDNKFKTNSNLIYSLDAMVYFELTPHLSLGLNYWNRYNSNFFDNLNKSGINPFLKASFRNVHFRFGPVFSFLRYPSEFENRFNMQGNLGYTFERKTK